MNRVEIVSLTAALGPILIGIAVLVAQRLIAGPRALLRDDPVNLGLNVVGWVLIVVGFLANFAAILLVLTFLVLTIPGLIIAALVLIEALRKRRATQQYALLWLLTVSAEHSMPLTPAIEAFGRERGGLFGRRAKRLAKMLNAGFPLPAALEGCRGVLPRHATAMVRVGWQSGELAAALRQAASVQSLHEPVWMSLVGKLTYIFFVPLFAFGVLMFVFLKIVPAYEKIFKDFGTVLPPITRSLVSCGYFLVNYWYLLAPLNLFVGLLILYAMVRYFGLIQWDPPGIATIVRRLDAANILDSLALVARRQRPILDGIDQLAAAYHKPQIRWRLRAVAEDIRTGRDWCESLYRRGLLRRADLAILQSAQRAGNLPWAMQEMAESGRRRFAYRLQAIVQAVFPPIVICFGLIVMFIVVALFLPLVAIIQRLT
jgi:type II secretory pathway component PulF